MSLLTLQGVEKVFGGLKALRGVSLSVETGQIFGLIGPNGAGKTTAFNVVTGVYRPDGGRVQFDGEDISGWKPAQVAARGIARTFQNIRVFRSMSVEENVLVAGHHLHKASLFGTLTRNRGLLEDERALREKARELLGIMGLSDVAHDEAGSLPYGSQRRLEIARALMLQPEIGAARRAGRGHE
ncbi:MAG: ATP-binding cassette domain-containing protein [Polyangiaceae bacterium]